MRTKDVTDTLDLALQASGCDQVHVVQKPRLLSDNGSSYVSGDLANGCKAKAGSPRARHLIILRRRAGLNETHSKLTLV